MNFRKLLREKYLENMKSDIPCIALFSIGVTKYSFENNNQKKRKERECKVLFSVEN